ncbi:type IV pilus modification protein PilV [Dyella subtropica]|uniref:type IV pilus modification protein PilV n=1 Tax=Dyella subtropica TaxID=2992127 RepID=UPI002B1CB29C|nr:type IV pilus modification protein PilV [Dyella subtropica]
MTHSQISSLPRVSASMGDRTGGRRRQSGVGLIEVMVAVLVLSIAFLGMAALQARSLSTNNSAMARSMATIAAYSIQDAMRADLANATGGVYNKKVAADSCPASSSSSSLATVQLNQWCNQLGGTLGAAATTTGEINCMTSGVCTITVTFDDSRAGAGGASNQQVTTRGML